MRSIRFRGVIVVLSLLLAISCLLSNFQLSLPFPLPQADIKLGLDLKGGVNLTLGVGLDKALHNSLILLGQDLRAIAKENNVQILSVQVNDRNELSFILPQAQREEALKEILKKHFPQLQIMQNTQDGSKIKYAMTYLPQYAASQEKLVMDQMLRTIQNRIDQFGVAEPDIRRQGKDQIQVQLPGLEDTERARQLIGQTAELSFHRVRQDLQTDSPLPAGVSRYPMQRGEQQTTLILEDAPLLTGKDIADARPAFDDKNQAYIALQFTPYGATAFERITEELVHQPFAIVLDGVVESAPVIQQVIRGGKASITGQFTTEQAQDLAIVLRAGSLPAPVDILEERAVGPSLGAESIHSGLLAGLAGAISVMLIMLACYRKSGVLADAMLFFTLALLFTGLGLFGATLTLPGIAGIVLTIGMAVDANVLIFERIKEELQQGQKLKKAVDLGFQRAAVSITDSNLTTIVAAIILYEFGTGPIRGFAVTLALGIAASMYTAIFVSHWLFDIWVQHSPRTGLEPRIAVKEASAQGVLHE